MNSHIHKSVGIVITNADKDLFYFQQKDETYWIKQFRMKYCLFGGQIENNEIEKLALERELLEELDIKAAGRVYENSHKILNSFFEGVLKQEEKFALYESILTINEIMNIANLPIKEGKRGVLMGRDGLLRQRFMLDQHKPLQEYFELNNIKFN